MVRRLLITGSRGFTAADMMNDAITQAIAELGARTVLVHGAARGADELADALAPTFRLSVERWPADWHEGHLAGPIRNQAMVNAGANLCLAFFVTWLPCRGTQDCVRRALLADIPVRRFVQRSA